MNKFLKQYQAFWTPEIGDRVRVKKEVQSLYSNRIGYISLIYRRESIFYSISFDGFIAARVFYKEDIELI
jgi:hypothetical protein